MDGPTIIDVLRSCSLRDANKTLSSTCSLLKDPKLLTLTSRMAILYSIYGILKLKGIEESIIMLVFGTIQTLLNKMEGCTGHEQMALSVLISLAPWIPADVSWSLTQLLVDQPIPLEKITSAFKIFMLRHGQKIQPHLKTILETLMPTIRKATTDVEKQCFGQVAEILAETLDKNSDCTIELYLYECYTSYKKFYIETSSNKKSKEIQLNSLAKILCKLNSERLYPEVRWMLKEMDALRSTEQSIAYTLIEPLRTLIEDASLMPSPNLESLPNLMEVLLCLIGIFKIHKSVEGQAAATACRQLIIQLACAHSSVFYAYIRRGLNHHNEHLCLKTFNLIREIFVEKDFEGNKKSFLSKLLLLMFEEQKNNVIPGFNDE
ncbi:hypothetical protein NDU88_005795 [Pleurodeles waltl]|uniref:MROH2B-like N-terminal HEAT-repeats domain-containing protein n=1 Tax=Pleurodeles waltl TaxID=8319 RepID=A0AAV7WVP6_PLEWA|nr:hypothetical protein NDU88_005795 [Pleurodeles waltl]